MRGQKLIKKIKPELLDELAGDYKRFIFKEKIKKNFCSVAQISSQLLLVAGVIAGVIVIAAIAPNIVGIIAKSTKRKNARLYFNCDKKKFSQALVYLKNRKYINISSADVGTEINLTDKGRRRYGLFVLDKLEIKKPKKWDGKWRFVIFDIPERLKIAREALREKLNNLDFYQLQKSVFVFPYPCEREVNFIRELFGVSNLVHLVSADYFQSENEVKKHFGIDL
jgi:hypothetical protein